MTHPQDGPPAPGDLEIVCGRWCAAVTTVGAALRDLTCDGEPVLDGSAAGVRPRGARGEVLAPWTNRLRDGRYVFDGTSHQLRVTDESTGTALHGLVSARTWAVRRSEDDVVQLEHVLQGEPGYPWRLRLTVTYAVTPTGLVATQAVDNLSIAAAPYAVGAHPYLLAGPGPVDDWSIGLDAAQVMLVDDRRMLPLDVVDVGAAGLDLRVPRRLGTDRLNHAFTGLARDEDGRCRVVVSSPDGRQVVLWGGDGVRWLQLYTGDFDEVAPRRSVAVEPMSAPADAFNSGRDLVVLAPAGRPGSSHRLQWGIDVAG